MCLQGTAYSDYPAIDSPFYRNVQCPFLILSVEGDPAHPTATATGFQDFVMRLFILFSSYAKFFLN